MKQEFRELKEEVKKLREELQRCRPPTMQPVYVPYVPQFPYWQWQQWPYNVTWCGQNTSVSNQATHTLGY